MKKLSIAGMFLWNVQIEYTGDTYLNRRESRTLKIATRHKAIAEAQRKAALILKAFRYDYPKGKIIGVEYDGFIDA